MGDRLLAFGLGPLLLLQGRRVRRATPLLPEPPGPRRGTAGAGPDLRLLILGDSAAAGVGAAHQDEALAGRLVDHLAARWRVAWRLDAVSGATTGATCRRLAAAGPDPRDVVVTSLGVNDVVGRQGVGAWRAGQERLVGLVRARCAPRLIILSGLPPMHAFPALPQPLRWYLGRRARHFDVALAAWAAGQPDLIHLPTNAVDDPGLMAGDGFHPGPLAYGLWAAALAATIAQELS